ncbi:hypothetical protein PLICRDRAFT_114784 [Plicaturopsis crispa FD-325 SS-3]|nr:hypothetical protein PLICRDRAFT_114784 [Plicaturopsis crispa FD-325 SS-3]
MPRGTRRLNIWDEFISDGTKYRDNKSHKNAWCKACVTAKARVLEQKDHDAIMNGEGRHSRSEGEYLEDARIHHVTPISGRPSETMLNHILRCAHVPESVRQQYQRTEPSGAEKENVPALGSSPASTSTAQIARNRGSESPLKRQPRTWSNAEQKEFEKDLLQVFVSCGFAWNAANNIDFRWFMHKWLNGLHVPDRRTLAGRLLDAEVEAVDAKVKEAVRGKLGTGQCDGWKNIAKVSLLASMVTVEGQIYVLHAFDVSGERKTGENAFARMEQEVEYCEKILRIEVIAWASDNGPDSKKGRRLLIRVRPWMIGIECWGHQTSLILGDYLKANPRFIIIIDIAIDIVKWFNNHSVALGILREAQKAGPLEKVLALILPVITRWTAHLCTVSRLLIVQVPLRTCAIRYHEQLLGAAGTKAEQKAKAGEILGHVGNPAFWNDLAIIEKHLTPLGIATNVAQASSTRLDHVLLMLANLYRIYGKPDMGTEARTTMHASLEKRWAQCDRDIFILANKTVDLVRVWQTIDTGLNSGRNALVKLAIRILSIIANSAGCERLFTPEGDVSDDELPSNPIASTPRTQATTSAGPSQPAAPAPAAPPRGKEQYLLKNLFDYESGGLLKYGIDFYWKDGKDNFEHETAVHDAFAQLDLDTSFS